MLAKMVDKSGRDWDTHLPFVLFAYRTSVQELTKESPFYLNEISIKLAEAWELAKRNNKMVQGNQKLQYDRNSN